MIFSSQPHHVTSRSKLPVTWLLAIKLLFFSSSCSCDNFELLLCVLIRAWPWLESVCLLHVLYYIIMFLCCIRLNKIIDRVLKKFELSQLTRKKSEKEICIWSPVTVCVHSSLLPTSIGNRSNLSLWSPNTFFFPFLSIFSWSPAIPHSSPFVSPQHIWQAAGNIDCLSNLFFWPKEYVEPGHIIILACSWDLYSRKGSDLAIIFKGTT